MEKINILAIGAHPDDIEFGCGGTLIKFSEKGHRVFLLIMTRGGMGGSTDVRCREQEASGAILGAEHIFWGDYEDTHLVVDKDTIVFIENILKEIRPVFTLCSFPDDTHQDHRHLSQATLSATRYVRNVLFYEGPTTQNFTPQVFVDISGVMGKKTEALRSHRSQVMKTNIENLSILELAESTAVFRGIQGRVKHAEAFHSQRLFINI